MGRMDHIYGEQKRHLEKLAAQKRKRIAAYVGLFILAGVTAIVLVYAMMRA